MEEKETPCIVYITDDNYVDYTLTSIKSVLLNTDRKLKIYVICYQLARENRERLLVDPCIETIDYENYDICSYGSNRHVTPTSFIKFDIPHLIKEDRCLYIDGDTIAVDDVLQMYEFNVSDYMAAVMKDFGKHYIWKTEKSSIPFYSGTMLLNLKKMRETNMPERLHAEKKKHLGESGWGDQEVFNTIFNGMVKFVPVRFCVSYEKIKHGTHREYRDVSLYNALYGTGYKNMEEFLADSVIFHFHGDNQKVYSHRDIYEMVDRVEEDFLNRNDSRTFIFSNVCRFEDPEEFRDKIKDLAIKPNDTLFFLNTAVWLTRFSKDIPPCHIKTLHRFKRDSSGWWGLKELSQFKYTQGIDHDVEMMLLDNKGNVSTLNSRLLARVDLAGYPTIKVPTTGCYALAYAKQIGCHNIHLINFYGSKDSSTPHFTGHDWKYEENLLQKEKHLYLEPKEYQSSENKIEASPKKNVVRTFPVNSKSLKTIIPRMGCGKPGWNW